MYKETTVIINPASAGGKTAGKIELIKKMVTSHICRSPKINITSSPWDAVAITKKAIKRGSSRIIAVGGDGTLQEVVNGYFENGYLIASECSLGIINCGTGGGLAQSLGISRSLMEQIQIIKKNNLKRIDCGRVKYFDHDGNPVIKYFVNEIQFGIGGTVVSQTGKIKKRLAGKLTFGFTTLKSVFSHPNQHMSLEINNYKKVDGSFTGIVVANGAFTGGGMNLTPGAETNDGYFNVLLINGLSTKDRLIAFSKIYTGKHIKNGKFSYFPATVVKVSSKEKVLFEADGELLGNLPCSVEVVPKSIPVFVGN